MNWLIDNANWIFSGVGIVIFTGLGFVVKRILNREPQGQYQNASNGSTAIQAGRDVHLGHSSNQHSE